MRSRCCVMSSSCVEIGTRCGRLNIRGSQLGFCCSEISIRYCRVSSGCCGC